jgi:sugar lactone lactonase YvrE
MSRRSLVVVATAGAVFASVGGAWAQLQISTLVGRQIGDGRAATAASLNRPFGIEFAPDGALLIADRAHARIRRVDPNTGVITTVAGSVTGGRNGVAADQGEVKGPLRVHVDPMSGDMIITDRDAHTIRRVVAASGLITRIAGSQDTPGSTGDGGFATGALLDQPADAFPDATGAILIADRNNNKIRRIDTLGTILPVAGSGAPGYTGDNVNGGALVAHFNAPSCVLPIDADSFYVCDSLNHVIRRVDGATVRTVAGTGTAGFADGPAATAQFNNPINLAFDAAGNLLIVDRDNNRLRVLDLGSNTVSTIGGTGEETVSADGQPAATSPISGPSGITLAPDGRVVFAEEGSHRVRAIDAGGAIVTVAGDGISVFGGDGGPAVDAQFGQVKSVTRDLADRFLISDDGSARVRRLDPCTGLVETVAGNGSRAFGGDGGQALDAGLAPSDAVVDASGNIIVCDTDNDRIRIIDTTGLINTLVGTGVGGYSGDGGLAKEAQIDRPTGIEIDAAGSLYIADFDNDVVRRVTGGIINTIAGTGVAGYNGDDILATTAQLNSPSDIEIDAAGNVYIADFNNHRIRRIDAATGNITTVAGTGVAGDTGDGGLATAARLNQPSDMKFDETGALWVTDLSNHRVRRFTIGGNIETVAGTGLRGFAGDGGLATDARLMFPVQLHVINSQQVVVSDRDNFVVRAIGNITSDCTKVADDCRGAGAPTCIPGGGPAKKDCFGEFKFKTALPGSVPAPRITCTDGDPACDADDVNGQCTFRLSLCLNNEDARLSCSPGGTTSVKLSGKAASGAGAQAIVSAIGALGATPSGNGRGVTFPSAFTERNQCTPFSDFVVARTKKKAKSKLGAVIATSGSGKDKDKLKLICQQP